jgi:hypothetical protein
VASASAIGQSETQTASAAREPSAAKTVTSGSKRQTRYLSQGWGMLTTFKGTDVVGRDNIGFVTNMLFDGIAKIMGVVADSAVLARRTFNAVPGRFGQ